MLLAKKLSKKHTLRYTPAEEIKLRTMAALSGVSFAAYMRAVIRQHIRTPLKLAQTPTRRRA